MKRNCQVELSPVGERDEAGSRHARGVDTASLWLKLCVDRRVSEASSPMTMQGAIVFPVTTLGMMDPSAIRRFSIP